MGRAGREMSSKRRAEGREGEMVYLGNGQMTGDESERLSSNFHASAVPADRSGRGLGGTTRRGFGFQILKPVSNRINTRRPKMTSIFPDV